MTTDTASAPPNVRRFLDLHVRHLPGGMAHQLTGMEGVTAEEGYYGVWCWVPFNPTAYFDDYPEVPDELLAVLEYARAADCDYVRFDENGPADRYLPFYNDRTSQ